MSRDPNKNPTQARKILTRLQETPDQWVEMPELARVSGAYAVHSRISQLRGEGHDIEHKQERLFHSTQRASFYKLITPKAPA